MRSSSFVAAKCFERYCFCDSISSGRPLLSCHALLGVSALPVRFCRRCRFCVCPGLSPPPSARPCADARKRRPSPVENSDEWMCSFPSQLCAIGFTRLVASTMSFADTYLSGRTVPVPDIARACVCRELRSSAPAEPLLVGVSTPPLLLAYTARGEDIARHCESRKSCLEASPLVGLVRYSLVAASGRLCSSST